MSRAANNRDTVVASLLAEVTTKRRAIQIAREEANAVIEQMTRIDRGIDRGMYRADDTLRIWTIRESVALSVSTAFRLSAQFANR